jgi:hypothetical protein
VEPPTHPLGGLGGLQNPRVPPRQGVGRAMIDEMVTWLRTDGVDHMTGFATNEFMDRIFQHHAITPGL